MERESKWEYLDDLFDVLPVKRTKPVSYAMATLKRVESARNRHIREGRLDKQTRIT